MPRILQFSLIFLLFLHLVKTPVDLRVCVCVCVMIIAVVSRRQTLSVHSAADFISLREVRSGKELSYKSVFHFVV